MATPVAHKGATQAAKVEAMTALDLLMRPELVTAARDYFENVQQAPKSIQAAAAAGRQAGRLAEQRDDGSVQAGAAKVLLRPDEVQSYLEQLGIAYPPPMPPAPSTTKPQQ